MLEPQFPLAISQTPVTACRDVCISQYQINNSVDAFARRRINNEIPFRYSGNETVEWRRASKRLWGSLPQSCGARRTEPPL